MKERTRIAELTELIKENPKNAEAYYSRGVAKSRIYMHKDAIKDFNRAIELDPKNADAYFNRGVTNFKVGYYEDAETDYKKATELNPRLKDADYERKLIKISKQVIKQLNNNYNITNENNITKEKQTPEEILKGTLTLLICIVIGYFIIKSCNEETPLSEKYTKFDALYESRRCVKEDLKAPSTADFDGSTEGTEKINSTTFIIRSHFDAENEFGAKLRRYYSCKIVFLDKIGRVRCSDLKIRKNKIR